MCVTPSSAHAVPHATTGITCYSAVRAQNSCAYTRQQKCPRLDSHHPDMGYGICWLIRCIGSAFFAPSCHIATLHVLAGMATDTITVVLTLKTGRKVGVLAPVRPALRWYAHMMPTMCGHTPPHTRICAHMCGYGQGPCGGT